MRVIPGEAQGAPIAATTAILGALLALSLTIISGRPATIVAMVLVVTAIVVSARSALLRWRTLFVLLLFAVLFIPIGRYRLPGSLPFQLEPYRILVAFILLVWFGALLIDPRVKFRRSGFEAPLILIGIAMLGSIVANGDRIASLNLSSDVVKTASFQLSFFLVFYFVVSTVRWPRDVNTAVTVLVAGGSVIAVLAIIESRTGFNPFAHLSFIPGFEQREVQYEVTRYGKIRAAGPAQHPIALGALLEILIPLAVYLVVARREKRWWIAAALLAVGANSAVSRTPVIMMLASLLAVVFIRPREAVRYWPALVPALILIHFALPGTLGSLRAQFFPSGGLVAQQQVHATSQSSAGRVADLSPSLSEASAKPLFGQGLGTRITTGPTANARLLDDQWLGTLLETGIAGLVGWVWLFWRFFRRAGLAAKRGASEEAWLLTALVASVAGFGAGMFLYDAFAFIQVTFVFFFLLGLGAVVLTQGTAGRSAPRPG